MSESWARKHAIENPGHRTREGLDDSGSCDDCRERSPAYNLAAARIERPVMSLPDFLLQRLDEDEAAAKAASSGPWTYGDVESVAGGTLYDESRRIADLVYEQPDDHDGSIVRHLLVPEADANGRHIARHDPARVLADVEAKRRIVDWAAPVVDWERVETDRPGVYDKRPLRHANEDGEDLLRLLALPYADHADFREEWRV